MISRRVPVPVPPKWVAATALVLVAATASCELDLTEIETPIIDPSLTLRVEVRELNGPAHVGAMLVPGVARDGRVRELEHDTLWIADTALLPARYGDRQVREYRLAQPLSAGGAIRVRAPGLVESAVAPAELEVVPARIAGPDTIITGAPDTIEIRIDGVDGASAASAGHWHLRLMDDSRPYAVVELDVREPPPPVIRVPTDLVPDGFEIGMVRIDGTIGTVREDVVGPYAVSVLQAFTADIPVRIRRSPRGGSD